MVALRVLVLGGFEARLAAGDTLSLPTKKAQVLLAYLALQPGHAHQRSKLAALLWGKRSDDHARDGLRHALVALRKALGGIAPAPLLTDRQTLALDSTVVDVDATTFQRRIEEGTPGALEHAAQLYRGDLLLGIGVSEPLFEEWLLAERERLREMALEAQVRLLAHQARNGNTEPAIRTALRLLTLDPLQEAVHRTLMRLYARQGRRGAALKQYHVCVDALRRELGADPETTTSELYQELLRCGPSRSRPVPEVSQPHVRPDGAVPSEVGTPLAGHAPHLRHLRAALDEAD
jgi:DNA-binding SARP family transcriptional activator